METQNDIDTVKKSIIPKYGAYFLAFIIISKIIYLGVEVFYNGYLIDVITNSTVTQESLEFIESLGHNVSSIGLTLLVLPFFYLLYKKLMPTKQQRFMPLYMMISTVALFFSFHTALTSLMDKIVEDNKDKRYTSYYISAFKYSMLNGSTGYKSFMPQSHLENPTIEDRVILSNIFLLNYIDKKLIDNLINKGQDQFADVFILKYGHDDYMQAQNTFESKAEEIKNGYNKYLEKSKEINRKFAKLDNAAVLDAEYQDFTGKLRQKYADYERKVIQYEKSINISDSRRNKISNDLEKYFKYQGYTKAKRKYKRAMNQQFGHWISPSRWCSGGYCPSDRAIDRVIAEEGYTKFTKNSGGIPPDLSQRNFYKHPKVKSRVIKELRAKGMYVSKNFRYSKKEFARAYKSKINKEFKKVKKQFSSELKKQLGKSIPFGLKYSQFVYRFKTDFIKKYGKKYGTILYKMVQNKDTSKFYSKFYKPKFKNEYLKEYLLTKNDFNSEEHKELGDAAIKHLFIPPFAIGMSLMAGILNFISVVVMLLFLVIKTDSLTPRVQFALKATIKVTILSLLIWYPFFKIDGKNTLSQYKAIEKVKENPNTRYYVTILEWIMVYEKLNYNTLYPIFKSNK